MPSVLPMRARVLLLPSVPFSFSFLLFPDTIVRNADPAEFEVSVCVRTEDHNIARRISQRDKDKLLPGNSRAGCVQTAWKLSRLLKEWEDG